MYFQILRLITFLSFSTCGVQPLGNIIQEDLDYRILADKYYDIQKINTGCKKEVQLSRDEARALPPLVDSRRDWKTPTDKMIGKIKKQYNNLKCTYVFSALYHFRMIKYFLQNGKSIKSLLKKEQLLCLEFDVETVDMLSSMWNIGIGDEINEIWYMHMYNDSLHNFLQTAYSKETNENGIHNIVSANDSVTQVLEMFANSRCDKENKFNYKKNNNQPAETVSMRLDKLASNKCEINKLVESNIEHGAALVGNKYFYTNWLHLNNILSTKESVDYIIESFQIQINGEAIFKRLSKQFYGTQYSLNSSLFDRIKKTENYVRDVLDFFKTIMLRIVWKYFLYCNHLIHSHSATNLKSKWFAGIQVAGRSLQKVLKSSHRIILACLEGFVQLFDLREDTDLLEIHRMIGNKNSTEISGVDLIVEKIKSVLNSLFPGSSFDVGDEKYENPNYSAELENRLKTFCHQNHLNVLEANVNYIVRCSVYNAKVFIAYLQRELNNISFNVIQSFLKFSREIKMENNRVEIQSNKTLGVANFIDLSKILH